MAPLRRLRSGAQIDQSNAERCPSRGRVSGNETLFSVLGGLFGRSKSNVIHILRTDGYWHVNRLFGLACRNGTVDSIRK
ncbi:hypothetical protein EMIT0111MI5_10499 [Burkholderia sp. IT-111MI5]